MVGNLRVWWIPQVGVGLKPFYIPVKSVEEAKMVMDILAAYDCYQYNHNIKPDYCNTGGVEMFDKDNNEWVDWEFEDDNGEFYFDDIDEYLEEMSDDYCALKEVSKELFSQVKF